MKKSNSRENSERVANNFSPFEGCGSTAALMTSLCSRSKHKGGIVERKKERSIQRCSDD